MANLFDSASLLLVASAFKSAKAYSVIPTDGDGDFTFARAATSSRTKSDGTTETGIATNVPALHYGTAGDPETCPSFRVENSTAAATFTLSNIVTNSILTGTAGTLMLEGKIPDNATGFFSLQLNSDPTNNRIRIENKGFAVKQGGDVYAHRNIYDSDGTHMVTRIAVSWSGAGDAASATPTLLFSQNGETKTSTLTEWSDATRFDEIVITGHNTDDSDEIKVIALWDTALTQTELNTITSGS